MNNFGIFDFLTKLSDACTGQTPVNNPAKAKPEVEAQRIIYKNTQTEKPKKHYSDKEIMEATKKHLALSRQLDENNET